MVKQYRRRYILFRVLTEGDVVDRDGVSAAVQKVLYLLLGAIGLSQAHASIISYSSMRKLGILRCTHISLNAVRAALIFIREINGVKSSLIALKVSGTLRSLRVYEKK